MGPFPHDAPKATISDANPAGTDGFEFVEFASETPDDLRIPRCCRNGGQLAPIRGQWRAGPNVDSAYAHPTGPVQSPLPYKCSVDAWLL